MSRAFFDPEHGSLNTTLLVSHVKTALNPPFEKGEQGGFNAGGKPRLCEIPLNPPFSKGEAARGSDIIAQRCAAHRLKLIRPCRLCGGFTYIGVLLAVAFIGVALAATGTVWQQTRQREKERELLFVGGQFRQALERYYENPPPGKAKKFPQKLEDLLRDDRHPDVRRYLRKLYPDPMTGGAEWGLLRGADKAIVGLYSLSDGEPLKTANFDPEDAELAGKRHYHEWRFIAMKGGVTAVAVTADNVEAAVPPSGQPDVMPQADTQQNLPAVEPLPPPQHEPPPGAPRSAVCSSAFINARAGCMVIAQKGGMASASDCLRTAGVQYAQCLK